jgi:hypothetical protein
MFPVIFITAIIISAIDSHNNEPDGGFAMIMCVFWLMGGMLTVAVRSDKDYKQTAQVETTPVMIKLNDGGLDIVLDDYTHHHWTDYSQISKWEKGGKFYKTYSFDKENFGPDSDKFELIIK